MDYNGIIDRVGINIGSPTPDSVERAIIKRDIYDVMLLLLRKSDGAKKEYTTEITTAATSLIVNPEIFTLKEVIFYAESGNPYFIKEVEYEKLMRWNPNTDTSTQSFNDVFTEATPIEMFFSQENEDLDGNVAYAILDTASSVTLHWKPATNGSIKIYGSYLPTEEITSLAAKPIIHAAFHEAIVNGVSEKNLVRKLSKCNNEIQFAAMSRQVSYYAAQYKLNMADYIGYTEKKVGTSTCLPFDFLNDPNMQL